MKRLNILNILLLPIEKYKTFRRKVSYASRSQRILGNSSGQGAVEYLLLIFIVVTVMVGGMYQFHGAFKAFSDNYFGDYVQCLLEAGELPSLGVQDEDGICNESFEAFSLSNGRPPLQNASASNSGATSGNSSSPSSRNTGNNGRTNVVTRNPGGGADGPNSAGTTTAAQAGGDVSSLGASSRMRQARVAANSSGGFGANRNKKVPTNFKADTYTNLGSNSTDGLRRRYIGVRGEAGQNIEGEVAAQGLGTTESNFATRGRTNKVPVGDKKQRQIASEEEELTFAGFLRYLVIIAMAIAVLLFLGNQMQGISKSME